RVLDEGKALHEEVRELVIDLGDTRQGGRHGSPGTQHGARCARGADKLMGRAWPSPGSSLACAGGRIRGPSLPGRRGPERDGQPGVSGTTPLEAFQSGGRALTLAEIACTEERSRGDALFSSMKNGVEEANTHKGLK